jgi:hypothetical protein
MCGRGRRHQRHGDVNPRHAVMDAVVGFRRCSRRWNLSPPPGEWHLVWPKGPRHAPELPQASPKGGIRDGESDCAATG